MNAHSSLASISTASVHTRVHTSTQLKQPDPDCWKHPIIIAKKTQNTERGRLLVFCQRVYKMNQKAQARTTFWFRLLQRRESSENIFSKHCQTHTDGSSKHGWKQCIPFYCWNYSFLCVCVCYGSKGCFDRFSTVIQCWRVYLSHMQLNINTYFGNTRVNISRVCTTLLDKVHSVQRVGQK